MKKDCRIYGISLRMNICIMEVKDGEERTVKAALRRKKKKTFITTKGTPIKLSVDFSEENLQGMRGAKRVNLLTKNALPVKAPFRSKSEIKILSNKN